MMIAKRCEKARLSDRPDITARKDEATIDTEA